MMHDLIIEDGLVIDGSGTPKTKADIAILNGRISAIGHLKDETALKRMGVSGKMVCPGFVDAHNHSEGWLLKQGHFTHKTKQGYTTEVLFSDGVSYAPVSDETSLEWMHYLYALNGLKAREYAGWKSVDDFMKLLNKRTAQNVIAEIPYANVRSMVAGFGSRPLTQKELGAVRKIIEHGMADGAVGLSTGLDYATQCYASTEELTEACEAMNKGKGLYVTHIRYAIGRLKALQEAVEICRKARIPLHVSHFMGKTEEEGEALLNYVDKVAMSEVDFSFDSIPYTSSFTLLNAQLPIEIWEEGPLAAIQKLDQPEIVKAFEKNLSNLPLNQFYIAWIPPNYPRHCIGMTLLEFAQATHKPVVYATIDLLKETQLTVLCLYRYTSETMVHPFLSHKAFMLGSDGIWQADGLVHPRIHGCTGRMLGACVKKHRLFTLEEAVRKMTALPCTRFGLKDRGMVRVGYAADIVVFDAEKIDAHADFQNPRNETTGIESVLVNGVPIIQNDDVLNDSENPFPGRALRFHRD